MSSSLMQGASTHFCCQIPAKTGPCTESYSGLFVCDPRKEASLQNVRMNVCGHSLLHASAAHLEGHQICSSKRAWRRRSTGGGCADHGRSVPRCGHSQRSSTVRPFFECVLTRTAAVVIFDVLSSLLCGHLCCVVIFAVWSSLL